MLQSVLSMETVNEYILFLLYSFPIRVALQTGPIGRGGEEKGHLAPASSSKGPLAQRMSRFQNLLVMRLSSSKEHIL
jgi:hypothetical protein